MALYIFIPFLNRVFSVYLKVYRSLLHSILISFFIFIGCEQKAVNIYDSVEYKNFDSKDLIVGESIWATACFRCHMYGTNGAVVLETKNYWDKAANKGINKLYDSVWKGYEGEHGKMPAKGFCNLCDEEEIKKSVLYLFHLAKKAQAYQKEHKKSARD